MRSFTWLFTFTSLCSAGLIDLAPRQAKACNNAASLCSKKYDEIVHLGAHNSPFLRDATTDFSESGNQYYSTTVQLDSGVRLLSGQVHKSNNEWHLCHSSCDLLDAGRLFLWLAEIRTWMDKNPNDVVTIVLVNSDNAKRSDLDSEFRRANITKHAFSPSFDKAPESWPTLDDLIKANTRLMTFVASLDAADNPQQKYLMNEFDYIFENNFENRKVEDFSCAPSRPQLPTIQDALSSNRMPFMNHFLYKVIDVFGQDIDTPDEDKIATTNSPSISQNGSLGAAANKCSTAYSNRPPTFVLVDFFDQGPAIDTVDRLNNVTSPTGRKAVPARDTTVDKSESTFEGIKALVKQVSFGEKPSMGAWIWGAGQWTLGGLNVNGGNLIG